MNKRNKLARNAIRARKAKNKRANEQDKPKKGKRWLTRLGTLIGCLLLVSALVVPCFAQDCPDIGEKGIEIIYDDFYHANMYGPLSLRSMMPTPAASDDVKREFFNKYAIVSTFRMATGDLNDPQSNKPYPLPLPDSFYGNDSAGDDPLRYVFELKSNIDEGEGCDITVVIGPYDDLTTIKYTNVSLVYYLESDYAYGYQRFLVTLKILTGDDPSVYDYISYGSVDRDDPYNSLLAAGAVLQGQSYLHDDLRTADVSIAFRSSKSIAILGAVSRLLLGNYSDPDVGESYDIVYPNYFLSSALVILNSENYPSYDDGYEVGHDAGYNEGFDVGYGRGYSVGSSSAFGEDLLGDTLTAPLKALEEFNLVSWRTANGGLIEISIVTILSAIVAVGLFFLFIKMFAGG